MSSLLFKFSKATNFFETIIRSCSQNSTAHRSLSTSNFCVFCLLTDCLPLIQVQQAAISITAPMRDWISGICECHIYLNAISCLSTCDQAECEAGHQERFRCIYEGFDVGTPCY